MDFKTALQNNNQNEIIRCVKSGMDLNKMIDYKFPIFYLIENENIELIELFFSYGANINSFTSECPKSPVMYAIQLKKEKIIQLLISYGANLSFITHTYTEGFDIDFHSLTLSTNVIYWTYEKNPFLSAYIYGHTKAVKYILNNELFKVKREYFLYFNEYESNIERNKIKNMLKDSLKIWNPSRHYISSNNKKKNIELLLNIRNKTPFYIPIELWFEIFKFI